MNTSASPNTQTPAPQTIANRPTMPMQVRIALGPLGAEVLFGLYGAVQAWSEMPSTLPAEVRFIVIGMPVALFALQALFTAGLVWRQNWARIGWLVLTLIGLAGLLFAGQSSPNVPQRPASAVMLGNATLVINLVVMYLLFATSGRHWFRRDEPEHV